MPIVQQRGSADCVFLPLAQLSSGLSCDESRKNLGKTSRKTTLTPLYCVCSLPAEYDSMIGVWKTTDQQITDYTVKVGWNFAQY